MCRFALAGDQAGYAPSWRHTNFFTPVLRECEAVIERVGITDLTPFSKYGTPGLLAAALALTALGRERHTRLYKLSFPIAFAPRNSRISRISFLLLPDILFRYSWGTLGTCAHAPANLQV